jgi:hypothetical protein
LSIFIFSEQNKLYFIKTIFLYRAEINGYRTLNDKKDFIRAKVYENSYLVTERLNISYILEDNITRKKYEVCRGAFKAAYNITETTLSNICEDIKKSFISSSRVINDRTNVVSQMEHNLAQMVKDLNIDLPQTKIYLTRCPNTEEAQIAYAYLNNLFT